MIVKSLGWKEAKVKRCGEMMMLSKKARTIPKPVVRAHGIMEKVGAQLLVDDCLVVRMD